MTPVDHHNHILLAKLTEMLAAAKASGIGEFSITEHVSQFREPRESVRFGSVHYRGRIFESLKEYDEEFRKADKQAEWGMKVNRGLEVDFSPRFRREWATLSTRKSGTFSSALFTNSRMGRILRRVLAGLSSRP